MRGTEYNVAAMLRRVDVPLCQAKGWGRNQVCLEALMAVRAFGKQGPCQCTLDNAPASSTGASKYGCS